MAIDNATPTLTGHPMQTRLSYKKQHQTHDVTGEDKRRDCGTQTTANTKKRPRSIRSEDTSVDSLSEVDTSEEDEEEEEEEEPQDEEEEEEDDIYEDDEEGDDTYDEEEARYLSGLDVLTYEKIRSMEKEVREFGRQDVPIRFRVLMSDMDINTKSVIVKKLDRMTETEGDDAKLAAYAAAILSIPFGVYRSLPITFEKHAPLEISAFLDRTRTILDEHVYGQDAIKRQFILTLAKWIARPDAPGLVLGIEGPPGVGKTTLIKDGLCKALSLPFAFLPLGGANDTSFLDGHSFTYEGSTWGRVVDAVMQAGCLNPVLCFDELDKVADNSRGNEVFNILVHLTDVTQNNSFCDKYFADIPLDLSRAIMVFTYNDASKIPPVLKDRMVTLKTKEYTKQDKFRIMTEYVLPKTLDAFGFKAPRDTVTFDEDVVRRLVEASQANGVRDVKKKIEFIVSNVNLSRLNSGDKDKVFECRVTRKMADAFLEQFGDGDEDPMSANKNMMYL
jgi:ATP-dependent Lon protease